MSTLDGAKNSLLRCQGVLQQHFDEAAAVSVEAIDFEVLKKRKNYFDWVAKKTELISNEHTFALPCSVIPGKVSEYLYTYLSQNQDKKIVLDKYYNKDSETGGYLLSAPRTSAPQNDIDVLVHNLVLRRGHVVWVHFGFNIGDEFGGHHPAIILRNTKTKLIVLPLSSQSPNHPQFNVKVDMVYGLPLMPRWANVTRIVPVSILRIDFDNSIGSIQNKILKEISNKLVQHGIK